MKRIVLILSFLLPVLFVRASDHQSGSPVDVLPDSDQQVVPTNDLRNTPSFQSDLNSVKSAASGEMLPITISNGGKLSITSGHSVVLKPGTKVEAGGKLTVRVEEEKVSKVTRKRHKKSVIETVSPKPVVASAVIVKSYWVLYPMPESTGFIAANEGSSALLPSRVRLAEDQVLCQAVKHLFLNSTELISENEIKDNNAALPVSRWGETPGNIGVMRT